MKRIFTFLFLIALVSTSFGQIERFFDFETAVDTGWVVFANTGMGGPQDISIVANPLQVDPNTSDSCLMFHVRPGADRWVGFFTDYHLVEMTEEAHTLVAMVYKEVISPVGLKVERSLNDGPDETIKAPNTVTDEWELLSFEFVNAIGYFYERFTIFPDFPDDARQETDSTDVWMDNIGVPQEDNTTVKEFGDSKMWLYPTPATNRMAVQCEKMTGIVISDVMGRQVKSMKFDITDSKVIPTADLSSGIYFITAETTKGRVTLRFLKQ